MIDDEEPHQRGAAREGRVPRSWPSPRPRCA